MNEDKFKEIQKIESEMAADWPWMYQGEITSKTRPINSLLAEHLDFDVAMKIPEKISKETTSWLEGIIKQRILDALFDDPVRKSVQ